MLRSEIISYLDAELKKIKKVNGYLTDVGNNVFAWRDAPLQKIELPGLIYRDALVSRTHGTIGRFRWTLRVEIAVFGRSAEEIRQAVADVIKVIGICDANRFGDKAVTTDLVSGDLLIERHDIETGAAIITCEILYEGNKWSV